MISNIFRWQCKDRRYKIREKDTEKTYFYKQPMCQWDKKYSAYPDEFECVLTFCDNATEVPNTSHNYAFEWDKNVIELDDSYVYPCQEDMKIENNTDTKDQASDHSIVKCGSEGLLLYPDPWPQCSSTVYCGDPPQPSENGTRVWLTGADGDDSYATNIEYGCVDGSQFDTTDDSVGDSLTVEITCEWRKKWSPWPSLPPCIITHCVQPFPIPDITMLEEVTSEWTPINTEKVYRCKGMDKANNVHTRFFEKDRSLSSFSMTCLPNGHYQFVNDLDNWPVCLEGDYSCSLAKINKSLGVINKQNNIIRY